MKRLALGIVLMSVACLDLGAQTLATFHVFPQLADGGLNDGTFYFSAVSAVNASAQPASCVIRLYGNIASRFSTPSTTFTLAASGGFTTVLSIIVNGAIFPLATGYGTSTCSQPVSAQAAYLNANLNGRPFAGTSVLSAPPITQAEMGVAQDSGYRTAFAIANNTDSAGQYQLRV